MARLRTRTERAATLHRSVSALTSAAAAILKTYAPASAPIEQYTEQHDLTGSLRANAAPLVPGWLGAPLDALAPTTPLGGPLPPTFVRVGQAQPLDDSRFPVIVPLLRAGHIAIDADARDNRVAGLLRSLTLRLLASCPPGSVRIRTIDGAGSGTTFAWFSGIDAIMPETATSIESLRHVLDEGERWIAARSADGTGPTLLIIIASLPELTDAQDFARIAALAHGGPAGRLHVIVAGWPPPPLTAETTQAPLPHATQISLRNPYAWIGDPPGATFGANGIGPSRLSAPVYLDPDPPLELVREVCSQLSRPWVSPPAPVGEPSRQAWMEYVSAAQRLHAARQETTAVVAEHTAALATAKEDLSLVLSKLAHHQAQLDKLVRDNGGRPVDVTPAWSQVEQARHQLTTPPASHTSVPAAAPARPNPPRPTSPAPIRPALGTLPSRISFALRQCATALDTSITALESQDRAERLANRRWRNGFVYTFFAIVAAVVQVPLLLAADGEHQLSVVALPCALTLPLLSFGLGWLTVGMWRSRSPGRTPLMGAVLSLIALVPIAVYLTGVALDAYR